MKPMAKAKKEPEVIEEEVIEEVVEEKPKKTSKKAEPEVDEEKERLLEEAHEIQEAQQKQIKLYLKTDTPYVAEPNINLNIAGMFKKGEVLYVQQKIDNGINGKFYKINDRAYINQKWDVEVF
jgi:predicted nucleotide-binding protein (sugar kinase/HSP70/actin superfamily)